MKKIVLLLFLFLLPGTGIYSQQIITGFSTGMGTYSMSELKSLNEAALPSFDAKLVSDFPPYLYFQFFSAMDLDEFSFGLTYTFQSTGSRISAKDYSGEYRLDMNVNSQNAGIYSAMNLISVRKQRLSIYAKAGLAFSNLRIIQHLDLAGTVIADQTSEFKALSTYLEPGISYSFSLTPSLGIGLNAGYSLQPGGQDFHRKGEKEAKLMNQSTGETIKPQWQGFRIGISLMYTGNSGNK